MSVRHHPFIIYDSDKRPPRAIEELQQVFRYRFLIFQLLRRDILTRYRRSVLGIAWTMLNPLGTMLILSIVFSQIFKMVDAYPAYVLSGITAWSFFSQASYAAIVNLVWGGGMLHRIYLPRTSFALSAIGTGAVNVLLSLVPMVLVLLITGIPINWTLIFLPIPILLIAMFALGVGLLVSSFAVYYPDVAEMYQILLTAWMYLTPVIYPEEILPEWIHNIVRFNPMYWMVKIFRAPIYQGRIPAWADILPCILISLIALVFGWWVFCQRADQMAYRV